jgi:lipoprotein-anchoring transpeptidase ErfK/SrfK
MWSPTRLGVTGTLAALVTVSVMIAGVAANLSARRSARAASLPGTAAVVTANAEPLITRPDHHAAAAQPAAQPTAVRPAAVSPATAASATMPLTLTAADHRDCPPTASACVDLTRHLTWLQGGGKITFGPIMMEPGNPRSAHKTPHGTFRVAWKAGPHYMSTIYHEPMPWATFFAVGGIAFHGGSLTRWSHGCVHMTVSNAHYYNTHLPIGAEVVVF